jgi:signal transduction histidine kinase
VLYNYLSNAIKFTPEDGRIDVHVVADEPGLFRIDVRDNGVGISEDDLGKLFVEFQQLDASAAKKYQGTGLGLALTKRVVEAHGGRVGVKSVLGQGSTFSATLPRVTSATPDAAEPGESVKNEDGERGKGAHVP